MPVTKLSAVIITFNEEKNIARCIESVREIADEILVVDSFSTDSTEKICRSLGVRFVQNPWPGYMEQKNYADSIAANDMILSVDADEALSGKLKESIRKAKAAWNSDGYEMNRLTSYCGHWIRHGSWYPDRKLRLFNRRKGRWAGGRIHEYVELEDGSRVSRLEGDLLHYSYETISDHVRQADHFTNITAEVAFSEGKKAGCFRILCGPVFKFLRDYFFRLGFLDGYYGFVVCQISANATFLKYIKLKRLNQQKPAPNP